MHHSVATVPLAVTAGMLYARAAAASIRPGPCRLFAFTPVLALLLVLPFSVPLYGARGLAAFFLVWLGEFKLLLLAFGRGPLDPALRPLPFVFTAALPVKLRRSPSQAADAAAATAETVALPLLSSGIKVAVMASVFRLLFRSKGTMHPYAAFALYGVAMYCVLDSLLPCLAVAGRALGMEMEPQFDRPYLSASLGDFWGRRWNLPASATLRAAVHDPVRARLGAPAGVLAAFLVSGLMHEVVLYYLTFRAPTGRVTAFFALHGACVCAERWCARRCVGRARSPRVVATPLVVGFVAGTAFWLFFPAIFGGGMDDLYLAENAALAASFLDAGAWLLRLVGLG
ncbi:putative long-chain-alcohol O-fatty-acyltransferase 4 [Panicum miliaceum]|uniref:Long-chain-alcohol O-fatty-acyltransferase 4 n=1 Tax=Panicum miliaceum TaxID=4540 RepID=A0A3L6S0E2_PANMI|nr:putative long-chain-alcohol O-fatty-acyltransferase 4 [Panicum miliaceum]